MKQTLSLEGFIKSLAALQQSTRTRTRWWVDEHDCIIGQFPDGVSRAKPHPCDDLEHIHLPQDWEDDTEEEPITALAAWRAGKHIKWENSNHARKFLGLSLEDAELIVRACRSRDGEPDLRKQIMEVIGLA